MCGLMFDKDNKLSFFSEFNQPDNLYREIKVLDCINLLIIL